MDVSPLIVQILDSEALTARWYSDDAVRTIQMGSLEEAADQGSGRRVIMITPGTDTLLTSATLPTTQQKRIRQALPFALEDQLAEDVDHLHFAIAQQTGHDTIDVAVINKELMLRWLAPFRNRGYEPIAIHPRILTLPYDEKKWCLLIEDGLVYIRSGINAGLCCDYAGLRPVLESLLEHCEVAPDQLEVITSDEARIQEQLKDLTPEILYTPPSDTLLYPHINTPPTIINLLQGEFSRKEQIGRMIRPWRTAAVLALFALTLQASVSLWESHQLESRTQYLKNAINQIYRTTFPDAKNIVNAKKQMADKLSQLQVSGNDADIFLDLFHETTRSLSRQTKIQLEKVIYRGGHLDVEVTTSDLQLLEQLKQQITTGTKLKVEIQSASSRNNQVEGRIRITRNES